jgi:hypothetical protein
VIGEGVVVVAGLALVPAFIATAKSRNFFVWWVFGLIVLPVAVVASLLVSRGRYVDCPHCRERVDRQATVCPHCRSPLGEPAAIT